MVGGGRERERGINESEMMVSETVEFKVKEEVDGR